MTLPIVRYVSANESEPVDPASGAGGIVDPPLSVRSARRRDVDSGAWTQFNHLTPLNAAGFLSPRVDRAFIFSWRAMARGTVPLAFGLSSIPVFATLATVGIYIFSWIGFGLGMAGVGPGRPAQSKLFQRANPLPDAMLASR